MIPTVIEIEQVGRITLSVRDTRATMRASHFAAAERWRDKMLGQHFTHRAKSKYGYAGRHPVTVKKKERLAAIGKVEMGGRVPLVASGFLKRTMQRLHRIVATPGRATVHMVGPSYLKVRPRPGQPDMAAEITATTEAERIELGDVGGEAFADTLRHIRYHKRKWYRG